MKITTVGQLIAALQRFNPTLPIMIKDETGKGYYPLSEHTIEAYQVAIAGLKAGKDYYADASGDDNGGYLDRFTAIVL